MKRVLKPGGWVQMVECYYMCQSDNGSINDTHALRQWSNNYIRALDGIKDLRAPLHFQTMFTAAGLTSVESRMIPLPLCGWSNGTLGCYRDLILSVPPRYMLAHSLRAGTRTKSHRQQIIESVGSEEHTKKQSNKRSEP